MSGPCIELVRDLCNRTLADLSAGEARDEVKAIAERLEEPLRIAVAGREKAGKSTLVNALLGVRVAQTDVGPCTKVVTRFLHAPNERAEVVLKGDRERRSLELRDRRLPMDLGVPPALAEEVVVYLSSDELRKASIIDTPGLASLDERTRERTEKLLAVNDEAVGGADVLVYLISQKPLESDVDAIKEFAELSAGFESTPVTTIALLSKADKIGDGDPAKIAELVERVGSSLREHVVTVMPVMGLLAETSVTGALTETHAATLRRAAKVGVDELLEGESDVSPEELKELLRLLDVYGLERAVEVVADGRGGAKEVRERLEEISGLGPLRSFLRDSFSEEADALKANAALAALERVRWRDGADGEVLRRLHDGIERVRLDPALHRISELWALQSCERVGLSDDQCADLRRVAGRGSAASRLGVPEATGADRLRSAAAAGAERWHESMLVATFSQRRVAEVAEACYLHLYRSLGTPAAAGAAS
jgi:GTP-binding protein EngB required for normal cell division